MISALNYTAAKIGLSHWAFKNVLREIKNLLKSLLSTFTSNEERGIQIACAQ
jgi:hypothetical protein